MSFKTQSNKTIDELTGRHRKYAELLAIGELTKRDALVAAGFSRTSDIDLIGPSRERSKYPALWDYYQQRRREHLRLFDVTAETVQNELKILAFSRITDFIHIPTREDLSRQALFDAKIRRQMGYTDSDDEALLAQEDTIRENISGSNAEKKLKRKLKTFAPGQGIKLKCREDIPDEILPAIASIRETRDGLELKLYNKLDALDKLARMLKLYSDEDGSDKSTTIENFNVIVKGSKSDLLDKLNEI